MNDRAAAFLGLVVIGVWGGDASTWAEAMLGVAIGASWYFLVRPLRPVRQADNEANP